MLASHVAAASRPRAHVLLGQVVPLSPPLACRTIRKQGGALLQHLHCRHAFNLLCCAVRVHKLARA
eukprot:6980107-Alexandrium_andersonii.AAC.1